MDEIKLILEEIINKNNEDPKGYSIFGYNLDNNRVYDIYLPTRGNDFFYYMFYKNGIFFDYNLQIIDILNYKKSRILTKHLIERNFYKILTYNQFFIKDHDRLNYRDYQNPTKNDADLYISAGYDAYENEEFEDALDNYSEAINEKPYDADLYRARASIFNKQKDSKNAIIEICKSGISNPVSVSNIFDSTYYKLAETHRDTKNYKEAIHYYTIILNNSQASYFLSNRAKCFVAIGLYDSAINDMKTLLSEKKDSIGDLYDLGEIYLTASLDSEAKDIFQQILKFSPKSDNIMLAEMIETHFKGYKDKAKKHIQKIESANATSETSEDDFDFGF